MPLNGALVRHANWRCQRPNLEALRIDWALPAYPDYLILNSEKVQSTEYGVFYSLTLLFKYLYPLDINIPKGYFQIAKKG